MYMFFACAFFFVLFNVCSPKSGLCVCVCVRARAQVKDVLEFYHCAVVVKTL
jgi:hypothetical protein